MRPIHVCMVDVDTLGLGGITGMTLVEENKAYGSMLQHFLFISINVYYEAAQSM